MKVGIRIERDGATLAEMELGPGEHGIGRSAENAVVLPDRAVSSRHALLRVTEKSVELIDQESLNGVYVDGHKIGRAAVAGETSAEICGFRLRLRPIHDARRLRPSLPAMDLRLAVLSILAALALGTLAAAWLPGKTAADEARLREGLRRGALLARFLAEENLAPLREKRLDQVRVTPVSAEDGVREAYVADPYGKILAPPANLGQSLEDPRALGAAKEPGVNLWTDPSGETILICPIKDGETLLGLAYLVFDPERAVPEAGSASGLALGLGCATLLWASAAFLILRLTLRPARLLAEEMGVALKSGAASLTFKPPSKEYAEMVQAAERILMLVPATGPDQAKPAKPAQPAQPAQPGQQGQQGQPGRQEVARSAGASAREDSRTGADVGINVTPASAAKAGGQAWCLLSLDGYALVDWSPAFAAYMAAPDMASPVHLLTALSDPALLAAVAESVEDPDPAAARRAQNSALKAVKRPWADPGVIRVEIEREDA